MSLPLYKIHRVKKIEYDDEMEIDTSMNNGFNDCFDYGLSPDDGIIYIEDYDLEQLSKCELLNDQQREFWKIQYEKSLLNSEGGLYYEIF